MALSWEGVVVWVFFVDDDDDDDVVIEGVVLVIISVSHVSALLLCEDEVTGEEGATDNDEDFALSEKDIDRIGGGGVLLSSKEELLLMLLDSDKS